RERRERRLRGPAGPARPAAARLPGRRARRGVRTSPADARHAAAGRYFEALTRTCRSRSVRTSLPCVVQALAFTLAPTGMTSVTDVPTRLRPRLLAFFTVNAPLPPVASPLSSTCRHFALCFCGDANA